MPDDATPYADSRARKCPVEPQRSNFVACAAERSRPACKAGPQLTRVRAGPVCRIAGQRPPVLQCARALPVASGSLTASAVAIARATDLETVSRQHDSRALVHYRVCSVVACMSRLRSLSHFQPVYDVHAKPPAAREPLRSLMEVMDKQNSGTHAATMYGVDAASSPRAASPPAALHGATSWCAARTQAFLCPSIIRILHAPRRLRSRCRWCVRPCQARPDVLQPSWPTRTLPPAAKTRPTL